MSDQPSPKRSNGQVNYISSLASNKETVNLFLNSVRRYLVQGLHRRRWIESVLFRLSYLIIRESHDKLFLSGQSATHTTDQVIDTTRL